MRRHGPVIAHCTDSEDFPNLVLITNRKSHMGFRLVPESASLNDLEQRNGHFALFYQIRQN